jgi:hypothetical protein
MQMARLAGIDRDDTPVVRLTSDDRDEILAAMKDVQVKVFRSRVTGSVLDGRVKQPGHSGAVQLQQEDPANAARGDSPRGTTTRRPACAGPSKITYI